MAKRGENIHKRKDGRWEGRYKKGKDSNGKTVYGSVYGKTYAEAKEKLIKSIANQHKTDNVSKDYLFSEILELWKASKFRNVKGSTKLKYENTIEKHILPCLGQRRISVINSILLNEYISQKLERGRLDKKGGLSPSYIKNIMAIVFSAIDFAVDEKLCEPIVLSNCKISVEKKSITVLEQKEQERLESYLLINTDKTKLGTFISLRTGLRIGEICALRWTDIDFINMVIHLRATISRVKNSDGKGTKLIIEKPKTKASIRDIPIPSDLYKVLIAMKKQSSSSFVVSDNCKFVPPRTFEYRYHKVLKASGVLPVNYHALRHTFATRCIEKGVDVKSLSEILGHSNVSITLNTYVHSSMEYKRIQIEKLSNLSA